MLNTLLDWLLMLMFAPFLLIGAYFFLDILAWYITNKSITRRFNELEARLQKKAAEEKARRNR